MLSTFLAGAAAACIIGHAVLACFSRFILEMRARNALKMTAETARTAFGSALRRKTIYAVGGDYKKIRIDTPQNLPDDLLFFVIEYEWKGGSYALARNSVSVPQAALKGPTTDDASSSDDDDAALLVDIEAIIATIRKRGDDLNIAEIDNAYEYLELYAGPTEMFEGNEVSFAEILLCELITKNIYPLACKPDPKDVAMSLLYSRRKDDASVAWRTPIDAACSRPMQAYAEALERVGADPKKKI